VDRYDKGINCILADEMGLGKTLQTIAFFAHLKDVRKIQGPHLVVVPLSVLFNWMSECKKFCPSLRVIRLHTSSAEKSTEGAKLSRTDEYDVCVTTYEMIKLPGLQAALSRMHWRSVVLDEGHRIKNIETAITKACNRLK
jgi:SWI/SNF-related matrix-associated actin-dependent regulator of chromatin subfamily A member 5